MNSIYSCILSIKQVFPKILLLLLMTQLVFANDITPAMREAQDIIRMQGEIHLIPGLWPVRVAIGDGALLKVQTLETGELLLIGQADGTTELQVWDKQNIRHEFKIRVHNNNANQTLLMRKIVNMKVQILEFREKSLKKIGLNWSDTTAGPTFFIAKDFIASSSYAVLNQLQPTLNPVGQRQGSPVFLGSNMALSSVIQFLQTSGHATSLAQPTLSCLSGESAEFLAGGEIPFPTIGSNGETVVSFKDYGIRLNISPKADDQGRIATAIETEVSSIDQSVQVNGAPGFLTRRTKTHMNVMSGQTIIIAGLLTQTKSRDLEYMPGLGNLPVVGHFFRSNAMSQEQTQLVIFITPEVFDLNSSSVNDTHQPKVTKASKQEFNRILDSGMADIQIKVEG